MGLELKFHIKYFTMSDYPLNPNFQEEIPETIYWEQIPSSVEDSRIPAKLEELLVDKGWDKLKPTE